MIVLCYRAGEGIAGVLEPLERQLEDAGLDYELVLVANHHPGVLDDTPHVVEKFARGRERVRVVAEPKARACGMGFDMRSGFAAASGEWLLVLDGDGQNPVEDVLRVYREARRSGAALVKGRRSTRHDGLQRRVWTLLYNVVFRALFPARGLWDVNGKPKCLRRSVYEQLTLEADDWFADSEIVLALLRGGGGIVEVPVVFLANERRDSFVGWGAIREFAANVLRYRLRRW